MPKIGELDLLPVPGWAAYPSYFISAGGLGYLILSWLMYYISQYLPLGTSMDNFSGAQFLAVDTAQPDPYDLPPDDWASTRLFTIAGDLEDIISQINAGQYPGIKDFYIDTPIAQQARREIRNNLGDGAGTTRPFGRIGFFYNWDAFYPRLEKLIKAPIRPPAMRFGGEGRILTTDQGAGRRHFFIISSLAGGTGSSCFLDLAATLRYLHRQSFPHEKWVIIGVFTLAEVLAVDVKVEQEVKRTRMRANTYAALKELNHFLSDNLFAARYGREGIGVRVPEAADDSPLFDRVFLVDTPNQDQRPLSGRMEVAQFLAQSLLLLGLTPLCHGFFQRLVDSAALDVFIRQSPEDPPNVVKEKQLSLYSSLGLSTLALPIPQLLEYAQYRLARLLFNQIFPREAGAIAEDEAGSDQLAQASGLTDRQLEAAFINCLPSVLPDENGRFDQIRQANNPQEELRRQGQLLENLNSDQIRTEANKIGNIVYQRVFPADGGGPLREELDRRPLSQVVVLIRGLINDLTAYRQRLEDELATAEIQANAREAPGGVRSFQPGIFENQRFQNNLGVLEAEWQNWWAHLPGYGSRFVNRHEGLLRESIDLLQLAQTNAQIILVWPSKIALVNRLITTLNRWQDDYDRQQSYLSLIQADIFAREKDGEEKINKTFISRFRVLALTPGEYFDNIFTPQLGDLQGLISGWSADLQKEGLPLGSGRQPLPSGWPSLARNTLVEALYQYCREKTGGRVVDPDQEITAASEYYQVGLDHELFRPTDRPSPFYGVVQDWKQQAQISILLRAAPETSGYVISGCRTEAGASNSWNDSLKMSGLSLVSGGAPNQAALLTLYLGFHLHSIAWMENWFKNAYIPQKRQGALLHLFNDDLQDLMVEPYRDWLGLPDQNAAEQIVQEANTLLLIQFHSSTIHGSGSQEILYLGEEAVLASLPERLKGFFFREIPQPQIYDRANLNELFQNPRLISALKAALTDRGITWDAHVSTNKLIQSAIDNNLLLAQGTLFYFDQALYFRFKGVIEEFCQTFFQQAPTLVLREITRPEFIQELTRNEPLCRWITKKLLTALIDPIRRDVTRQRYWNRQFPDFLSQVLDLHLP